MTPSRTDALRLLGALGWTVGAGFAVAGAADVVANGTVGMAAAMGLGFGFVAAADALDDQTRRAAGDALAALVWVVTIGVAYGAPFWPSIAVVVALGGIGAWLAWSSVRERVHANAW